VEAAAVVLAVQCASYASFCYSFALFCAASGGWTGIAAAVGTDIIPPSHRSTGIAAYFLVTTLLGPALGSYTAGVISDRTGSLSVGLLFCCLPLLLAAAGLIRLATLYSRDGRSIIALERQA
jgi:MFS family permease